MTERTNSEWIVDLKGPKQGQALADLRALLARGLGYALSSRTTVDEAHIEDFVQDALLKILDKLDSFRGESKFTTWAQKIAVHVAFTELRRLRWKDISLDGIVEATSGDWLPRSLSDPSAGPEKQAMQRLFLETLRRVISQELTDKQRQAMVAIVVQGIPMDEVAFLMGSNRNALYKLLHDARKRLKKKLLAEGLSPEDVLVAFGN